MTQEYRNLAEFYPFYLQEHSNRICRRLHFIGSSAALLCLALLLLTRNPMWLLAGLFSGYAFAWVGHFFFERNRPATFRYPWLSFRADWLMYRDMLTGRISF